MRLLAKPPTDEFEPFFDSAFPSAARAARRILGSQAAAEDVAAEALARAYARWSKVGVLEYRDAWVVRVAINLAIDQARRRRPGTDKGADPGFADSVAIRLTMVEALHTLPRRQREAIALRFLADLSEAQVAAALDVSSGTVKTHIHRGLEALRQRLGTSFEEVTHVGEA